MSKIPEKDILMLALRAGEIMLVSGSEIYRAEDTVTHICKAYGISYTEVFATTTGIFLSLDSGGDSKPYTIIKRIRNVSIDLDMISLINNFSRDITSNPIPIEEAKARLADISKVEKYKFPFQILGGGLAASFFTFMLGAGYREFIVTVFIGALSYALAHFLDINRFNRFSRNFTVCALIALAALLFKTSGLALNVDAMIVGPLMIFLPGLAFTNAMRDSLAGDLLAGGARAMEAILIALSISFGVGVTLFIWVSMGGVI